MLKRLFDLLAAGEESADGVMRARFESAELFRTAFDNAPNGMTLTGIDGPPIIVRANQAYADLIGRPLDELVGTAKACQAAGAGLVHVHIRDGEAACCTRPRRSRRTNEGILAPSSPVMCGARVHREHGSSGALALPT